jgi:hypothetical protein
MPARWIDRLARATAAAKVRRPHSQVAVSGEPMFNRATALKSAAAFGLAATFPVLRPHVARAADECTAKCDEWNRRTSREFFDICDGGPGYAPTLLVLPGFATARTVACAAGNGIGALIQARLCSRNDHVRDANGKCEFDGPDPPRPPRTVDHYPPAPPDPKPRPKKPPKPKKPRKRPGMCGNGPLPAGADCCPSSHGPVPCLTGCAKGGDGCCKSLRGSC